MHLHDIGGVAVRIVVGAVARLGDQRREQRRRQADSGRGTVEIGQRAGRRAVPEVDDEIVDVGIRRVERSGRTGDRAGGRSGRRNAALPPATAT